MPCPASPYGAVTWHSSNRRESGQGAAFVESMADGVGMRGAVTHAGLLLISPQSRLGADHRSSNMAISAMLNSSSPCFPVYDPAFCAESSKAFGSIGMPYGCGASPKT